jgi:1,2-diacylglycerol 3-alpha-glucosyltransferase
MSSAGRNTDRIKLALVSSGLGNTARGFETSTGRWFEALREHTSLDVRLYCGGAFPGGKRLWNFPRNSIWTSAAKFIPFMPEQNRWEFQYGVEQISFWSALNFESLDWKPDVVWCKDVPLAHLLYASRIMFGLKYKLIFANGSRFKPGTYQWFDLVQQIQQSCYDEALEHGIPDQKMELLSNCFRPMPVAVPRAEQRARLGLTAEDWVIVCVAAWNSYHKRIDYLLHEVAALNDPRIKLLLCGTPEVDTPKLRALGAALLGDRVRWMTVGENDVSSILNASDVFVLPSLQEGLGNALIEAAMCGLPVIAHPHEGARFSIADDYWLCDLSGSGNLTTRLQQLRSNPPSAERLNRLKADVSARFSAKQQAAQFERMVQRLLARTSSEMTLTAP